MANLIPPVIMKVFREIENVKVKREKPVKPVKIVSCVHETAKESFSVTESDATEYHLHITYKNIV